TPRQLGTGGWPELGQVFEETKPVTNARHRRHSQGSCIREHFAHECFGLCLIDRLLCCHDVAPFSVCILFVYVVGAALLPTIRSSMPEKGGFSTVESTE